MKKLLLFIPLILACTQPIFQPDNNTKLDSLITDYNQFKFVMSSINTYFQKWDSDQDSIFNDYRIRSRNWDSIQWYYFKQKTDSMQKVYLSAITFVAGELDSLHKQFDQHSHDVFAVDTIMFVRFEVRDNIYIDGHVYDSTIYKLIIDPKFKKMFEEQILSQ